MEMNNQLLERNARSLIFLRSTYKGAKFPSGISGLLHLPRNVGP